VAAFETLSFYLQEREVDTRYVISISHDWDANGIDEMLPYFKAHRSSACKALRALKNGQWCRISRATAESVGMTECKLCSPYSNKLRRREVGMRNVDSRNACVRCRTSAGAARHRSSADFEAIKRVQVVISTGLGIKPPSFHQAQWGSLSSDKWPVRLVLA
jgi:hypothetical protein